MSGESIREIKRNAILSSAAYVVEAENVRFYRPFIGQPQVGDLFYGRIDSIGKHSSLENTAGRIHLIGEGTKAVFVFGNRYAPDAYEGIVPDAVPKRVDLVARSGIVGGVREKTSFVKKPTRVRLYGQVVSRDGKPLNTLEIAAANLPRSRDTTRRRARLILNVGTAMNSGKTTTAMACVWALSSMSHRVTASKVTGTANLKEILSLQDCGAERVADFCFRGYPSTYLAELADVEGIFCALDDDLGQAPSDYWVVELADGILQRETAALLQSEYVRSRIHKLIFSARDACGALGGISLLERDFRLVPDVISGRCTSSPLAIRELSEHTEIPIMTSGGRRLRHLRTFFAD